MYVVTLEESFCTVHGYCQWKTHFSKCIFNVIHWHQAVIFNSSIFIVSFSFFGQINIVHPRHWRWSSSNTRAERTRQQRVRPTSRDSKLPCSRRIRQFHAHLSLPWLPHQLQSPWRWRYHGKDSVSYHGNWRIKRSVEESSPGYIQQILTLLSYSNEPSALGRWNMVREEDPTWSTWGLPPLQHSTHSPDIDEHSQRREDSERKNM